MNKMKPIMVALTVLAGSLGLPGCSLFQKMDVPSPEVPQQGEWTKPEISIDRETGIASMEISVLTYNIVALPWPIARGKTSRLTDEKGERIPIASNRKKGVIAIAKALADLRTQGEQPDVVLIQEAFLPMVSEIAEIAGYPNWVAGPGPDDTSPRYSERASESFIKDRRFWKGEKSGKRQSSGLLVISDFQIVKHANFAFYEWECAGYDCLANKGVILARLQIAGLPDPLEVVTAHYNAKGASGVPIERAHEAHRLQVDAAIEFLSDASNSDYPGIWAGDMNMRRSEDRLRYFVDQTEGRLNEVSSYCIANPANCKMHINDNSDTPWFETQDLQGWADGIRVSVEPIHMEEMFDKPVDGKMLSDHSGFLVVYRLSWPVQESGS